MRAKPTTLSTVSAPAKAASLTKPGQAGAIAAAAPPAPQLPEDTARRPYQPPRILFREPLEAMAAICTPHPPAKSNKGLCPMGPISS